MFTASQVHLVTHFSFYYYYYPLTLFLSARENETIRDRLTSGKSPLALRVSYGSLCARELSTLPQTISSVSYTFIYLWRAALNINHPLPLAPT